MKVDIGTLQSMAGQCRAEAAESTARHAHLSGNINTSVLEGWTDSQAAVQFTELYEQWRRSAQGVSDALNGMGGLLNASTPSAEVVAALRAEASSYRWAAATVGSQNAAGLQLGSGEPVMPIGGFNGTDPSPTLEQFQKLVAERKIHFFIGGGRGFGFGGSDTDRPSSQIRTWVTENFTSTTIDGVTIYDLTSPK